MLKNKVNRRRYCNNEITTKSMEYNWDNYGREYYYSHQKEFREYQRRYLEKVKTAIIYMVKDQDGEIIYFGSSVSKFRMNFHFGKYSKLDMKNRDWTMEYAEIDDVSRDELYYIEYILIAKHNPILNVIKPSLELDRFDFSDERKEDLISIADNLEFNIFSLET